MTIFDVCDLPTLFHAPCNASARISARQHAPSVYAQHPCCSLFRPYGTARMSCHRHAHCVHAACYFGPPYSTHSTASLPFASLFRPPPVNQFLFHSVCFPFPIRLSVRTRRRLSSFLGTLNVICIVPIGIALASPCRRVVVTVKGNSHVHTMQSGLFPKPKHRETTVLCVSFFESRDVLFAIKSY
jgi:hypothetical protein